MQRRARSTTASSRNGARRCRRRARRSGRSRSARRPSLPRNSVDLGLALDEDVLFVLGEIELVDHDDDFGEAEPFQEQRVAARLQRDAFVGRDDEDRRVDFGGAAEHVADELAMARRVDEHEVASGGAQPNARDVERDRLIALRAGTNRAENEYSTATPRLALIASSSASFSGMTCSRSTIRRPRIVDLPASTSPTITTRS